MGNISFFSKHRISKSKQIIFEEQFELHLSNDEKRPGCISILDRGFYYTTQEYGVYIRIPVPDEGSLYLTLFFLANTVKTVGFSMAMSVYRSVVFLGVLGKVIIFLFDWQERTDPSGMRQGK